MTVTLKMFKYMVKQITREMMMFMLVIAPVLIGIIIKFGIPLFERNILARYGMQDIIHPYYWVLSWLLAMVIGMLFAFVGGLVVLGEIDENISKYIFVTPVGVNGYIFSRIVIPALISGAVAFVFIPLFSLCKIDNLTLVVMVISNVLSGIITALLVVAISSNKVEGMAVGKLSGLFGATFFVPLLINGWIKYVFCLFPMYYIGKWSIGGGLFNLAIAAILFAVWIYILLNVFKKKFN